MSEPKITINVMPGAQMNGYVKEQHNYFGTVQQISSCEAKNGSGRCRGGRGCRGSQGSGK